MLLFTGTCVTHLHIHIISVLHAYTYTSRNAIVNRGLYLENGQLASVLTHVCRVYAHVFRDLDYLFVRTYSETLMP